MEWNMRRRRRVRSRFGHRDDDDDDAPPLEHCRTLQNIAERIAYHHGALGCHGADDDQ